MPAKKTIRTILSLAIIAIIFFLSIIILNNHIEKREIKSEIPDTLNYQVPSSLELSDFDLQEGSGELNLVLYEDYTDALSYDFAKTIEQAQTDFPDKLKIAYRFYNANNTILAKELALAIICAEEQDQGLELRKNIYRKLEESNGQIGLNRIITDKIALDVNSFETCMDNEENRIMVSSLKDRAEQLSIYGTPTAFLDGEIIIGAKPYENFTDSNDDEIEGLKQMIERKLN
ncbi:MAG: hypothetical protein EOM88_03690 [Clostridia bacterium]|nr:hypothetical protein [Clostridia bacterium]